MDESTKGTAAGAAGGGETVTVSGAEAKARFEELLARARRGAEVVVTEDGRAVARIVGAGAADGDRALTPDQLKAANELIDTARASTWASKGPWTREELYDR
jgi:prevent-host-death family protein